MKYRFENFELDSHDLTLSKDNIIQKIEPQILSLLELLISNAGRTVTKSEIIEKVWQGRHISDAAINTRLHAARAALDDDGKQQRLIKTLPNIGLRFIGDVEAVASVNSAATQTVEFPIQATRRFPPLTILSCLVLLGLGTLAILSFSLTRTEVTNYPASEFIFTDKAAILGHNRTRIWGLSVEECMRACLEEREYYCKSIDYTGVEKMCDLSDKSAEDVGGLKTDYPGSPHDHYARKAD